jgi:hypothetical protein
MIVVYDYIGQELSSVMADNDISNKANGIYLIRVLQEDGTVVSQKK